MTDTGWRVELSRSARRDLKRLDPPVRRRVLAALDGLSADPPQGDIRRLTGGEREWRLRVGDWRVRFTRHADERLAGVQRGDVLRADPVRLGRGAQAVVGILAP